MPKPEQAKTLPVYIGVLALLFCLDRATKIWAFRELLRPQVLIDRLLQLEFVPNGRIAFFLHMPAWASALIMATVIVFLVRLLIQAYAQRQQLLLGALGLVFIGACSNLLDRLQHGFVIDFINVPFWSVFNLADVYIVLGIIIVLFATRLDKKQKSSSL
jgi:signal peptidase II